jgi:hypothetical protein
VKGIEIDMVLTYAIEVVGLKGSPSLLWVSWIDRRNRNLGEYSSERVPNYQ